MAIESEIELQMDFDAKQSSIVRTESPKTNETATKNDENEKNAETNTEDAVLENVKDAEADIENAAIEKELDGGCQNDDSDHNDDDEPNDQETVDDDYISLSLDEDDMFNDVDDVAKR